MHESPTNLLASIKQSFLVPGSPRQGYDKRISPLNWLFLTLSHIFFDLFILFFHFGKYLLSANFVLLFVLSGRNSAPNNMPTELAHKEFTFQLEKCTANEQINFEEEELQTEWNALKTVTGSWGRRDGQRTTFYDLCPSLSWCTPRLAVFLRQSSFYKNLWSLLLIVFSLLQVLLSPLVGLF